MFQLFGYLVDGNARLCSGEDSPDSGSVNEHIHMELFCFFRTDLKFLGDKIRHIGAGLCFVNIMQGMNVTAPVKYEHLENMGIFLCQPDISVPGAAENI